MQLNERLQQFAREEILKDLEQCTPRQRQFFVLMYMMKDGQALPKDIKEDLTIEDLAIVVKQIPAEKLNWAMEQTRNTVIINLGAK